MRYRARLSVIVLGLSVGLACGPGTREGASAASADPADPVYVQVSAGLFHTCAVTDRGATLCWGRGDYGELGDGTHDDRSRPTPVRGLGSGVASVSVGQFQTCATLTSGAALCWGQNTVGQLGDGTQIDRSVPTPVDKLTSRVMSVSTGDDHACALLRSGDVLCWGANSNGQLGVGHTGGGRTRPSRVPYLPSAATAIEAGSSHTCAIVQGGALYCWGANHGGQLGEGTTTDRGTPQPVVGLTTGVRAVSAGFETTCAVLQTGTVRCWGLGADGELGNGSTTSRQTTPVDVGLGSAALDVAVGYADACARSASGPVSCWGDNSSYQLGQPGPSSSTPTVVPGLGSRPSQVTVGAGHACAVRSQGTAVCWGDNSYGQVGDGTTTTRARPVVVALP